MGVGVEPPDDAPVDDADASVGAEQQVARVYVAVESAPAQCG